MKSRHLLPAITLALAACGNTSSSIETSSDTAIPDIAMANAGCAFEVTGTAVPPSSGTPTVIDGITGTVIAANFFNSGAITNPETEAVVVCVQAPQSNGQQIATISTDVGLDDNTLIKAYPEFIFGSKFGNIWETSFRYYSNTGLPPEDTWPVNSTNGFELANLEFVASQIGLPAFTDSLPDITISLDMDEQNVVGANRDVMLESWFYDTSANSAIIGDNAATNSPLSDTLNNIIGIGHPAYDSLNNTLLEMMVHVGALSPNDISGSARSPGQHRLTENLNGLPDTDLDCINDAVDVDITGGPDADGDGIDDNKIAPVMIGPYVYSIWYGISELSPIVIFSRETNENCEYTMDLSSEGEIQLNWNDFIEYTLVEIEPLLQAANVSWASGPENPFPKMRASGGAIGGLEFGIEPQTNAPNDLPYTATINKLEVLVDGLPLGLSTIDTQTPITQITYPAANDDTIAPTSILTGTATDPDGSGFAFVQTILINLNTREYFDAASSTLTTQHTLNFATLLNTSNTSTDWQLPVTLPPGSYTLLSIARDSEGNEPLKPNGGRQWSRRDFIVAEVEQDPVTQILFPQANNDPIPSASLLTGTATDPDGSGFTFVQTMLINLNTREYFDAASGTLTTQRTLNFATLLNTSNTSTDWQLPVILPPGNYTLLSIARDNEGNEPLKPNGGRQWTRRDFTVATMDPAPVTQILFPQADNDTIPSSTLLTGTASDPDGTGFMFVQTILINLNTREYFDAASGTLTTQRTLNFATLINTSNTSTDWQLPVILPPGNYTLLSIARDNEGNEPLKPNGGRQWTRRDFTVATVDPAPVTQILFPQTNNDSIPSSSLLTGTASDPDGSGFAFVQTIVINLNTREYFDAASGTLTAQRTLNFATLINTSNTSTDWQLPVSLTPGNYILLSIARDSEGNEPLESNGGRQWTRRDFTVTQ